MKMINSFVLHIFPFTQNAAHSKGGNLLLGESLEPMAGIEPATSSLPRKCSTTELHRHFSRFERKTRLKLATLSLEG